MGKLAQKLGGQSQSQIQAKKSGGIVKSNKQGMPAPGKAAKGCGCGGSVK